MSAKQINQLVKMANQIALNMAAWGDAEAVARQTGEHIEKFWTRAMREQLLEFWRAEGEGLSSVACAVLAMMDEQQ
ncbi:MAG: formate dehydrogenase subunit delta [Halioglobus sp.]